MVEKEANEKGGEEANTPPHTRPQSAADGKTSQIVATLSRIIENATKVKRGAQDFLEVPEAQLRRVVEELRRVTEESTQLPQGDAITRILANTEDIKKKLAVQNQGAQKTWSQIVKGQPAQVATAQVNRQQNAERRKDRELIVTVINEEQRQIANRRSTQQVLESIQAREPKSTTGETVAVRQLASGDYQITLTSSTARKTLEQTTGWLQGIAETAQIKKTAYTVRAHGVRIKALDASNQEQCIETLRNANLKLHPGLSIMRIAWPKRILGGDQQYGSLIIDTPSIEQANRLISQGIVHEGEIKYCDRFIKEARVTQCVQCQEFGHIARFCKNTTRCGRCSGDHDTRECLKPATVRKCALCKGNHTAWSETCRHRIQARERADLALRTTPVLYEGSETSYEQFRFQTPAGTQTAVDEEGWQQVVRGRKGRPSHLTIAARAPNQSRIFATGSKRPRHESASPIRESRNGIEAGTSSNTSEPAATQ
jgi:hypothetical protein